MVLPLHSLPHDIVLLMCKTEQRLLRSLAPIVCGEAFDEAQPQACGLTHFGLAKHLTLRR